MERTYALEHEFLFINRLGLWAQTRLTRMQLLQKYRDAFAERRLDAYGKRMTQKQRDTVLSYIDDAIIISGE